MQQRHGVSPDGDWGWMVVVGAHVIQFLVAGTVCVFGLFLVEWLEEFEESVSATSWVIGLLPLLVGFLSPITNVLATRFGHRQICCIGAVLSSLGFLISAFAQSLTHLYLSFGVLLGVGAGLIFAPSLMMVGVYFKSRFPLANALTFAGAGIGQMVFPPLTTALISYYGWRGTLIIFAALQMNLLACSCLFRPLPKLQHDYLPHEGDEQSAKQSHCEDDIELKAKLGDDQSVTNVAEETAGTDSQLSICCGKTSTASGIPDLCRTSHFPVVLYTAFTIGIVAYCGTVYLVPRAIQLGYQKGQSALLLSLFGIGSLLGRLLHGVVIDLKLISTQMVFVLCLAATSAELLLTPLSSNFVMLGLFSFTFGFTMGVLSTLVFVISREVSPTQFLAPVLGFTVLAQSAGNGFGAPIGGWLFDATGNYGHVFYTAGGALSLATLIFLPTLRWLNNHKARTTTE